MKAASVRELKQELIRLPPKELVDLCLRLSTFKKENKELLTYLLFEASDEASYRQSVKIEVDREFSEINTKSFYFVKKSVRKILRNLKKYIRYSKNKETEAELLIYFCKKLKTMTPSIKKNRVLTNIFDRQIEISKKAIRTLHEDLQYDFETELKELT